VTFGATTLAGNPTFDLAAGTTVITGATNLGASPVTISVHRRGYDHDRHAQTAGWAWAIFALTKAGSGVLILPSSTAFVGNTMINGGILRMNSITSLGNNGTNTVTVNAGGTWAWAAPATLRTRFSCPVAPSRAPPGYRRLERPCRSHPQHHIHCRYGLQSLDAVAPPWMRT
jgi:autotransporter-associated beta strand protein